MSWFYIKRRTSVAQGETDPFFANVDLLLHCDGPNGSSTFTDSSSHGRIVTAQGGAVITTSFSKFGGAGGDLTGSKYLTFTSGGFNIRSGVWCIEGWGRHNSSGSYTFISGGTGGNDFYFQNLGGTLYLGDGVTNVIATGTFDGISGSDFTHWALSFDGTTYRIFFNGVLGPNTTSLLKNATVTNVELGARSGQSHFGSAYHDDIRLTIGQARYTASFTPPTSAFPNS